MGWNSLYPDGHSDGTLGIRQEGGEELAKGRGSLRICENNGMGLVLEREKRATITLTLPSELKKSIEAKAQALGVDFDEVIAVLLRCGLAEQNKKEQEISRLAEQVASSSEPNTSAAIDELGEIVFKR